MSFRTQVLVLLSAASLGALAYEPLKQGNCPYSFLTYPGNTCLHVSTTYISGSYKPYVWDEARELCRNMSSSEWTVDLVFSLNEDNAMQFSKFIVNEVPSMKYYVFFVGAEKDTPLGHWEWTDGQLVDPFSYVWNINAPSDDPGNAVKTMLVPSGAHNRFHMIEIPKERYAPSYVCQAAPKCD